MFVLICTKKSESFNVKNKPRSWHTIEPIRQQTFKSKRAFFPHLLDVTDKMAVELDPVATRQPTYNTFKRVGVVRVEPVVKEIERAVLEQDSAVFAAVEFSRDAVDILEFLDALVARVDAVRLVQETLRNVGWCIRVNHGGSSWKYVKIFIIIWHPTPFKIYLQRCKIKSFSLLSNTNDHYLWHQFS